MPKETFSDGEFELAVGWDKRHTVQVGVDAGSEFDFINEENSDGPYTSLWFTFNSRQEIDNFIKILQKAKRSTFS